MKLTARGGWVGWGRVGGRSLAGSSEVIAWAEVVVGGREW